MAWNHSETTLSRTRWTGLKRLETEKTKKARGTQTCHEQELSLKDRTVGKGELPVVGLLYTGKHYLHMCRDSPNGSGCQLQMCSSRPQAPC